MLEGYGYIGLFLVAAVLFAATMLLIPATLRLFGIVPHKPNPLKTETYECGMPTIGPAWVQFNFRYYFYALLFIAFDVLVVFLYPWAASLRSLGAFGLAVVFMLVLLVTVGFVYAWKKKVLEWK